MVQPHSSPYADTLANRPAAGIPNRYYWATDTNQLFRDDGTDWQLIETSQSCSQIYIVATAPTTITTAGTYYKMEGTTAVYQLVDFDHSDGRLTYTGVRTRKFDVVVTFTISCDKKDLAVTFQLYKNGGEGAIVASRILRTLRVVGDIYLMALSSIVELAQNDYVELWGTAEISGTKITVESMSFLICG